MSIYRVIISFFLNNMQYMQERGCLAMTPGQALDDVISNLGIDLTRVNMLKTMVHKPVVFGEFDADALMLQCINHDLSVRDLWRRRNGDI